MEYAELNEVLKNINASVVVYKVDENFHISMEYFNDRFAEIYGGTKEILYEELKNDITFGVASEYKQQIRNVFYEAVSTGKNGEATYRAVTKGSEDIWVNIKATPVKREKDTLVYVTFFNITEQVKATEQARRNEQYLESACEFANIFTWIYDIDTKIIRTGKILREQIGLPEEMENFPECIFKLNMVDAEYETLYRNKIALLNRGQNHVEFEAKAKLPDGLTHWIAYRFDIVEYVNGKPKIAVGTAQFVDVYKRLEARYQQEQKRKIVEDSSMFGYVISNINTNQVIERKNIQNKMQFSHNEYCYEIVADAFSKTIVSKVERDKWIDIHSIDNMLTSFRNGITAVELELNVLCMDGVMRWVREVLNLVQHPDTGEIILYNYFYDIHNRKVFGELMNAMANYGYELCGSLVANLDQLSLIYAGSHNHRMIIGSYTELNNGFFDLVFHEDLEMYQEMSSIEYIQNETAKDKNGYEITYRTLEDGEIHYKKAQCYLYNREEQTYLILRSDVTNAIKQEAEKRERLEKALVEAERANQAKSSFLSRMSHELRTPLNAINGYTSLIEENIKSGQINEDLLLRNVTVTHKATEYLLTIISDILDIQSIEQGKTIIRKDEINIKDYTKNIVNMIKQEAEAKNIEFSYERKTYFSKCYRMDGPRFQQILLNILHNAVKFTPEGGKILMTGETVKQSDDNIVLKISVVDNGIGMEQEFVEHQLFHKFVQENKDITSPYDGCGTGLFLSKELIQLMGGSITCKSEKGKGSEFVIQIPVECTANRRREREKKDSLAYDLSGVQVLLCEDNPMNQDMEKTILEHMNCKVIIADDGKIGLEKFEQSSYNYFDIILMDIRMPNLDGWEATKAIRALSREDAKSIPILAVSANAFEEDIQKSKEVGMNEHLAKPVDGRMLCQKIKEFIRQ